MPSMGLRNQSGQDLGKADHLDVEDRNFGAEWYDGVGGTSFIGGTVVPLGTTRHNSASEIFSLASNILTILEAGLYLFNFSATAAQVGSSELIYSLLLEEDPAIGTFSSVLGTNSVATFYNGSGTTYNSALLRVGINYRYRLSVARIGGSVSPSLVQYGSKLSVVRLFKNG